MRDIVEVSTQSLAKGKRKMLKGTKTYKIIVQQDDYTGEWGWVIDGLSDMDQPSVTSDPYLIAHDIIEHVNGIDEIGGIGEELQAMGGLWNTRGQHGLIRREYTPHSPQKSVGYDFSNMCIRFLQGEAMGCEIPELEESEFEDDFNDIWECALEVIEDELEYIELEDDEIEKKIKEFHKSAESLFHLGVIKHQKLYGDRLNAYTLFYGIVDALEGKIEHEPEYNERIQITINYDDLEVDAIYLEEEYEEEYS